MSCGYHKPYDMIRQLDRVEKKLDKVLSNQEEFYRRLDEIMNVKKSCCDGCCCKKNKQ